MGDITGEITTYVENLFTLKNCAPFLQPTITLWFDTQVLYDTVSWK